VFAGAFSVDTATARVGFGLPVSSSIDFIWVEGKVIFEASH
jgi:hypothetical protein